MGKISKGILGGFSGKVGNVVGGNWKGIDYMRIKPSTVANPQSKGQVDQRSRFSIALQFLQPMKEFIKVGFKNYAIKMTAFNSAMSYNVQNAVIGDYPEFEIDYASALLSRGGLAQALNANANAPAAGQVQFTWDDNSDYGNANATDKVMVLAYNPAKNEAIYLTGAALRNSGEQTLTVPNYFSGDVVLTYIAFISEDGKNVSNSTFVGGVEIPQLPD